jgi:thioredoxin 1
MARPSFVKTPTVRMVSARQNRVVSRHGVAEFFKGIAAQETSSTVVHEMSSAGYQDFISADEGSRVAVVDFYTTWCGPCKMIAPELDRMANEYSGRVRFGKINLVQSERTFAVEMNVKSLPTFHIYVDGVKVEEVIGAKPGKLKDSINNHLNSVRQ